MTHKHILYHTARWTAALSAAVVVAACSADSTPQAVVPGTTDADGRIPIVVNAAVGGAATRSLSANDPSVVGNTDAFITEQGSNKVFKSGQKVDLFIYEKDGVASSDYHGQLQYLKTGDPAGDLAAGHGTFTFHSDDARTSAAVTRYWPSSGKALNFYAYYPADFMATAGVTSVTSSSAETSAITIPYDQGNADVSKAHDLLFGAPNYRPINSQGASNPVAYPKNSTSAVNLNFKHCLSKIVIRIKGDGATLKNDHEHNGEDLDGTDRFNTATITLGPGLQHQYTLQPTTGVATATGETGTYNVKNSGVEAANDTDNHQSYYIIVPPGQQLDGKTITLKLGPDKHDTPGPTEEFEIPTIGSPGAHYSTEAGKVYTYSLVVSLHMIMSVTATIKDWETVTTPNIPTVIE